MKKGRSGLDGEAELQGSVNYRSSKWNFQDEVFPLTWIRSAPDQDKRFSYFCHRGRLFYQKYTGTFSAALHKIAEVLRHSVYIVGDQNATICRRKSKHLRIRNPFQAGFRCGKKVNGRFATAAGRDNIVIQAGIRKKPNRSMGSQLRSPSCCLAF